MSRVKAKSLSLLVDGKSVEIKNEKKGNGELNAAIRKPAGFREFAKDPKSFASRFGLSIDEDIARQLSERLGDVESIFDARTIADGGETNATAWAVAVGSYSVASSKIAVAF